MNREQGFKVAAILYEVAEQKISVLDAQDKIDSLFSESPSPDLHSAESAQEVLKPFIQKAGRHLEVVDKADALQAMTTFAASEVSCAVRERDEEIERLKNRLIKLADIDAPF